MKKRSETNDGGSKGETNDGSKKGEKRLSANIDAIDREADDLARQ